MLRDQSLVKTADKWAVLRSWNHNQRSWSIESASSMKPIDRSRQSSSPLTPDQERAVVALVQRRPGLTGRQIASELNLEKGSVNSFLYGEGQQKNGLVVRDWHWYLEEHLEGKSAPSARPEHTSHRQKTSGELPLEASLRTVELASPPRLRTVVSQPAAPGICRLLLQIPEARALKQISRMDVEAIDRAFGEEDYPGLGEHLQIALVNRRASLVDTQEQARLLRTTSLWGWLLRIAAVGVVIQLVWQLWRHLLSR
ncbi:MAG: hypothetical protein ACK546_00850 [bacterium]|jgi:hypothetical protein